MTGVSVDVQILREIRRRLEAVALLAGRVFTDRDFSVAGDVLPCIDVELLEAGVTSMAKPLDVYDLAIQIAITAKGDRFSIATEVADEYVVPAHKAVMADPTLGNLVASIRPTARRWRRSETEGMVVRVECMFLVKYACKSQDISIIQ